ncbi:hypothetical protein CYY_003303 [Polysphondylium violaceum]|uniref:Transmembrane protein n=1 Tax=Polysphondylium violaceum TaxID=133409 RepID=A0A8J4PYN6_9MYCE|nr:hypothetical protein CYY_003303 [Polysphondylium violaceum]
MVKVQLNAIAPVILICLVVFHQLVCGEYNALKKVYYKDGDCKSTDIISINIQNLCFIDNVIKINNATHFTRHYKKQLGFDCLSSTEYRGPSETRLFGKCIKEENEQPYKAFPMEYNPSSKQQISKAFKKNTDICHFGLYDSHCKQVLLSSFTQNNQCINLMNVVGRYSKVQCNTDDSHYEYACNKDCINCKLVFKDNSTKSTCNEQGGQYIIHYREKVL